ncbi:competence protein ComEA [Pseudomonas sp. SJZ079]|uniref:ComEA family DNA-binding protein n=1 Tax=Pseudomonas sp. SJZ079 TaxID=2572887 RepID=UPI00119C76D8|nr:helix-hairpin-helix domain-containing protein [Pseudomonas sp. SJZ079]TWC42918.1 competence protein ComEA [Pseudomonas sp. SJZ079]
MRKSYISSVLFGVLAAASLAVSAADTAKVTAEKPVAIQVAEAAKVNLNNADAPTLQRELSGIGETKAKAIVAYRDANGAFATVDELLEVKGIGVAILEKNRDKLSVN